MEVIEFSTAMPEEQIVTATTINIRLPEMPRRYYRHGWQSWSLAAWADTASEPPIPKPHILYPMQHDPLHSTRRGHHGSWVGAVETGSDEVLLLGSLDLEAHVALENQVLVGAYGAGTGSWYIAHGHEKAVFSKYAARLGELLGMPPKKAAPRVWCSWYGVYTAIDEQLLNQLIRDLGDLPFDVIQVDDGWQAAVGDWEPNAKFPSGMHTLADRIRSSGRRAGLWLAPLIAEQSSGLFDSHPGWFLRDTRGRLVSAGIGWGKRIYALDTTHPDALDWLRDLMRQVRNWGFDYLKLDFLYAGALPGKRYADIPREAAYRRGLQALREGMGTDAYFVACGAPILPSLGLCDALRVGPDVAESWETFRDAVLLQNPAIPGTRNAVRTVLHRLWLKPLVQPDPDVAYFRSVHCKLTDGQKQQLRSLALLCGFKATSDLPRWLSGDERELLRQFLQSEPRISQIGREKFEIDGQAVDFGSALNLPGAPAGLRAIESVALGWIANHAWALRLHHELGKWSLQNRIRKLKRQSGQDGNPV